MKTFIVNLYRKYNHAAILLYYFVIHKWFSYLEVSVRPRFYMFSKLDIYIPFVKEFVIPYLAWFAYIAVALIFLGFKSKVDFIKLSVFMFSGMSICLFIYSLFPNGQSLRPEIVGTDIFANLVRMVYSSDTPTNSAPSIHVVNSMAVHFSLVNYKGFSEKKYIKAASFIIMLLIIMSTVFIKQHSILDVVYGFILSMILYIFIYKINYSTLFGSLNLNRNQNQ